MEIKTPDDWWYALNRRWDDLTTLVIQDYRYHGALVVKPAWELESRVIGTPILDREDDCFQMEPEKTAGHLAELTMRWNKAREDKDHQTALELLNQAWSAAPDNRSIHHRPGWGTLCDLCSEGWVFNEDG